MNIQVQSDITRRSGRHQKSRNAPYVPKAVDGRGREMAAAVNKTITSLGIVEKDNWIPL